MWKEYQIEAAALFRSMGFEATIEAVIEGARGKHEIDVWVVGSVHGVQCKWVVECKDWKTNVPKEKALALIAIVQDVGADRGFLLSEVGFQSGALRVAQNTNITLTSIADLRESAQQSLQQAAAAQLHWRMTQVKQQLWRLHKQTDEYMSEYMRPIGEIAFLDLAIEEALGGKFPIVYAVRGNDERFEATNWEDLVAKASELLERAERFAAASASKKPGAGT